MSRITSYNVCYTKLLRLHIVQGVAQRCGRIGQIGDAAERPQGVERPERGIQHPGGGIQQPRITSYNVCYTKLLRIDQLFYQLHELQEIPGLSRNNFV